MTCRKRECPTCRRLYATWLTDERVCRACLELCAAVLKIEPKARAQPKYEPTHDVQLDLLGGKP